MGKRSCLQSFVAVALVDWRSYADSHQTPVVQRSSDDLARESNNQHGDK